MNQIGLIGYPITHSKSPELFAKLLKDNHLESEWNYKLFPVKSLEEEFKLLVEYTPKLKGLNVTIPYKTKIIPFLDELDPAAKKIGAVNTILVSGNKLIGYNTDVFGIEKSLKILFEDGVIPPVLILGNGGASKAVQYVLSNLEVPFKIIGRSGTFDESYQNLNKSILSKFPFIINSTPCGMFPNLDELPPFETSLLTKSNTILDLIYNPSQTKLIELSNLLGCKSMNGQMMLEEQAKKSLEIWRR